MLPDWVFDDDDRRYMALALEQAQKAAEGGEVPVGAVIVGEGGVIAAAHNRREELGDATGHAEVLALRAAGATNRSWRLSGCTLYVTLEPCAMCAAACRQARLDLVVWGAADPTQGACGSVLDLAQDPRLGPELAHRGGLEAEASRLILRSFFAKRRRSS